MSESTRPEPVLKRPDLANRHLVGLVGVVVIALVLLVVVAQLLPEQIKRPGSALLQSLAIAGSLLLLTPYVFSLKKRGGNAQVPNRLLIAHVVASLVGIVLVSVHAFASFSGPPLLMVASLVLLVVTGVVGRVVVSKKMAATLGTKPSAFIPADPDLKAKIRGVINEKVALLEQIDPDADEALFSVTLKHWLRSPLKALRYARLASAEANLVGNRASVSGLQAWWRLVHVLLAWGFLFGLLVHVLLATFFAGYVADGKEIYWWHLTAW